MVTAANATSHPLRYLCEEWLAKVNLGVKERDTKFGVYAQEALNFFNGDHNWMWDEASQGKGGFLDKNATKPTFRISVNKLFEAVALFGPALYSQNPNVLVSPLAMPEIPPEVLGFTADDPLYQQLFTEEIYAKQAREACAGVKQTYLNWLQHETDKKTQARRVINEAIVAGLGVMEVGMHQPPHSKITMPKARYLSWKDLAVDPDADYWEDVNWIAIRRIQAVNLVERRFGLAPGDLKGQYQSGNAQASSTGKNQAKQNRNGKSFDTIEYWEIFSKNGMGDKLAGVNQDTKPYDFEEWGDYCYLVVAKGVPFPLNMPSNYLLEATDKEELMARADWPVPYWYDSSAEGGWPIVRFSFYDDPRSIWPISLFKPAIGELRFVNWCLSFLADKVAQSCTTYVGVLKAAGIDIQKQLAGAATPFTVLEISQVTGKSLDEAVKFLQAPDFPQHIWVMLERVLDLIDKRTGLTELIYGLSSRQIRSATEATVRDSNLSVRPDDMAQSVENSLSLVNVREMQAARWFCEPQDVEPSVGKMGAMVWQNYVQTTDIDAVVRDFNYRIEAGSARKPNKGNKITQLQDFGQIVLPTLQQFAMQGIVNPFNAYIGDMAKAMDLDPQAYLIELPQQQGEQGPSPEEQSAQIAAQAKQAEMELKQVGMQMQLVHSEEKHDQDLRHDQEKFTADLKQDQEKAKLDIATAKKKATVAAKPKPVSKAR